MKRKICLGVFLVFYGTLTIWSQPRAGSWPLKPYQVLVDDPASIMLDHEKY